MTRNKPKHPLSGLGLVVLFAVGLGAVVAAGAVLDRAEQVVTWLTRPFGHQTDDDGLDGDPADTAFGDDLDEVPDEYRYLP